MEKEAKIYVAGHLGLVGSAIVKRLMEEGHTNLVTKARSELDLRNQIAVADFFERERPEYVFLSAAKVGGIHANATYRSDFLYDNLNIQTNVIHNSHKVGVKKLLFLGSSCIYPKEAPQPIPEDALLTGPLEYTNEPYAIAKIAGIKMCESFNLQHGTNFISVMPTNLYGPNDNFDLDNSHVIPAIIRKMVLAKWCLEKNYNAIQKDVGIRSEKEALDYIQGKGIHQDRLELWGSGRPLREFLWSEDLADACIHIMKHVNFSDLYAHGEDEIRNTHINIGTGEEISIKELAMIIKKNIGYKGKIIFDKAKPDGTMRKRLDVHKLHGLGWRHKIDLEEGLERLIMLYLGGKN